MSNLSFVRHTGDGKTRSFTLAVAGENIGYFRTSDIHGYVDDVEVPITINPSSPHIVTFTSTPKIGADILIRRQMPVKKTYADFARGNNFGHRQVNNTFVQQLYLTQEILDGFFPKGFYIKSDIDMGGHRLCNVGDAKLPNDAVTKYITDGLAHRIDMLENSVTGNSRFLPWQYNAEGGEQQLEPPYNFTSARLFINGVRQRAGAMGSYYVDNKVIHLAEPLEEGDCVDVELGTEPFDVGSSEVVAAKVNNIHTTRDSLVLKNGINIIDPLQMYTYKERVYFPSAKHLPFVTSVNLDNDIKAGKLVEDQYLTKELYRLQEGSIEAYMGNTDDAGVAFNKASSKLKLGCGRYTVKTPFEANNKAFKAIGCGVGETFINNLSNSPLIAANLDGGAFIDHLCARDFTIDANGSTGVRTSFSRYSDIQRLRVRGGDVGFEFKSVGSSYSYVESLSTERCRVGMKCGDGGQWTGAIKVNYFKATETTDYSVQCVAPAVLDVSYLVAENYGKSCCAVSASRGKEVKLRLYEPYMSPETNNVGLDTVTIDGGSGKAILEVHNSQSWNGAGLGDRNNFQAIYAGLKMAGNCIVRLFNCELEGHTKGERDAHRPEGWINGADIYTTSDQPRLFTENCRFLTRMRPPIPNAVTSENRSVKNYIENGNFFDTTTNIKVVTALDSDYSSNKTIVKSVENGVGGNRLIISKELSDTKGFGLQVSAQIPKHLIGKVLIFATGGFSIVDGFQQKLLISGGQFINDSKLMTHGDVFENISYANLPNRGREVTYNLRTYRPFKATSSEVKFIIQGSAGGKGARTVIDIDYCGVFKIEDMHQQCFAWHE